jgi:hypothetical protein
MPSRPWLRRVFWIDGLSALGAGIFVLSLRRFLSDAYALPSGLVAIVGVVNVVYSVLGLGLAVAKRRPLACVIALAGANYFWGGACVIIALSFAREARPLGLVHILFEGLYVATLATIEWRNRHALVRAGVVA